MSQEFCVTSRLDVNCFLRLFVLIGLILFLPLTFLSSQYIHTQRLKDFPKVYFCYSWHLKFYHRIKKTLKLFLASSALFLQDPSRRGSSDRFRLLIPWGRPYHWSSADASILSVQQRGPPGRWHTRGGGPQASRSPNGLKSHLSASITNLPIQLRDVWFSFMLLDIWNYIV